MSSITSHEEVENIWNLRRAAIAAGKCPLCNAEISPEEFKDELNRMEYSTSGLCHKCQDKIFDSCLYRQLEVNQDINCEDEEEPKEN